ncbi:aminotransferase-like domain-containing protein [Roseovarius sp. 217]|uniref:aminotransferase-like domain-containing protein n=1 Tax=Roseovarius sp. (strain 217) TaxID=314264 RepID=UPI0000684DEF|nr:PLP-dependent aminotransferase family protein [Roseovarius sp. 217]EAQ25621.1 putative aminotransferase [Roseovarius sp. 217]
MTRPTFAAWLSDTNDVTQTFLAAGQIPGLINLAGGLPDPATWPVNDLSKLAERAVANHPSEALAYAPISGLPILRDLIATRFSAPGLTLTRDNVLITTGGMQALDLIGKVLLEEGSLVAVQSPAYLGAFDAWRPRLPRYRPMVLEAGDFDPAAAFAGAQFAYTVPNFSNPSGRLVDLTQRQVLVEAAHQTGTWLVEDDPYGTLYYDGAPLPRMLTLSAQHGSGPYDGPVIYLGTLSKELAPGFRIGWVIAVPEMIAALVSAKQGSDMSTSGLCQRITYDAISTGLTDRVLPGILDLYRARRDALCTAMETHLADLFDWEVPSGGMFVWATARDPRLNTDDLLRVAMAHGVCVSPSSVFDPEGMNRRSIRVNFTLNNLETMIEGVRRLAVAAKSVLSKTG